MKLLMCMLLYGTCSCSGVTFSASSSLLPSAGCSPLPSASSSAFFSPSTAAQRAEVKKLRSELSAAFEAGEEAPEGVIVQPGWTKHGQGAMAKPRKVIVNKNALNAAEALRSEISQAVAKQGQSEEVSQLEAAIKAKTDSTQNHAVVASAREEILGSSQAAEPNQANVVDATRLDIDLAQLQQLELSKRRAREMLVLSRIVEYLPFTLGTDVSHWLQLQQNGSVYCVGRRIKDLLLWKQLALAYEGDSHRYEPLQPLLVPAGIDSMISYERLHAQAMQPESLLLLATQQQLLWYRLESGVGLIQFWQWPLGSNISKLLTFSVENREYLALMHNLTLSIYAYDVGRLEFWIVQRLQLNKTITALAVLDTGHDLLLAVGQSDEALIYAHNMRQQSSDAGMQLQLRQSLEAPQIADIAAFQMGGRSYLALGGQRPQILGYVQGQLVPKTLLGQNFGLVEMFLPVPVRSYRDDLLLLVQHRVYFDTHTLIQLEVLVWNGEAFEASLPAACELGAQTHHGAGCMLDELRDAGLAGAMLLRQMQPPKMLVPRLAAPSGLFRLDTQLLPRNSELYDLQEIHDLMRDWVDEQVKLLKIAGQLPQAKASLELMHYKQLNTPMLINEGAVLEALHVNEEPWTATDSAMDLPALLQQIRLLKQQLQGFDIGRPKRQPQLFLYDYEQLEFDVIQVEELAIEKLSHVPFFVKNATLLFNGSINAQHLELLQPKLIEKLESLPSSTQQCLQSNDISCESMNGLVWTEFIQQLVWRQEPIQLSQLQVYEDVVFDDSLRLSVLNKLNFPGDYLLSQGSSTSIVHLPKQFIHSLSANMVDTTGSINGVDPSYAVTLSDGQDWPGWVTFTQLEVSEELELKGSAQGRQFEEAPLNSMLTETHHIHAACHFSLLIVNGLLQLRGLLDNSNYDSLLGDLAHVPADANDVMLIPEAKHVQQLLLPVDTHVTDGLLSGIPLEKFVTKHAQQTLRNLSSLEGYVYFHQLQLSGVYDGIQLEQLLGQALRVNAPLLALTTRLRFANVPQLMELQVTEDWNDATLSSVYQMLHEPLNLSQARFERMRSDQLDVMGIVSGAGRLNGLDLIELLSSAPQSDKVQVQELILTMGLQASKLQGIKAELLLGFLRQLDDLPLLILHGQLQVQHIAVSGVVQVMGILNGRDLAQLQRDVVWLDRPNELRSRWSFQQAPIFANDLLLQSSYNERLLPELFDDIVFRTDKQQVLIIVGPKSFGASVSVLDDLQLQALNNVPLERLAKKMQQLDFAGELHLEGRMHVTNLQLQGELNGQKTSQLEEQLRRDRQLSAFVQRGLIRLPGQKQLQELTVLGQLGNRSMDPLHELFDNLLNGKRQPQQHLEGHKIFTGRVIILRGALVAELNGIGLEQLLQQLIFIDDVGGHNEVIIQTPVHFEAFVHMNDLHVELLVLLGERLSSCNISDLIHDTLRVDRNWQAKLPVSFAQSVFDNSAVHISELNELKIANLVTLHTPQNLSFPLITKELYLADGQVQLHGLVNRCNLADECANTLLINTPHEQMVETLLVMQSVVVSVSLLANSFINDNRNLSDVATLHEEQLQLQTPLSFNKIHAPELRTRLHINGFNYIAWHEKSLWAQGRATQVISGSWTVRWLRVRQPQLTEQPAHEVYRRQSIALAGRYEKLCKRIAKLFGLLCLPYQVKQLRRSFALHQATGTAVVRRAFALQSSAVEAISYLLLNELGCWTRIYRWNGKNYASAGNFESGPVDDVAMLQLRNATNRLFSLMTRYELSEEHLERSFNCSSLTNLQDWRTSSDTKIKPMGVPMPTLQQKYEAQQLQTRGPSYQEAVKYLSRPSAESQLRPHLDALHVLTQEQCELLRYRLLEHLSIRLQTKVNITQLSIPENDLYDDENLVEDFLLLMRQVHLASKSESKVFASLPTDTLILPIGPARVLAARSVQLIWPVLKKLKALRGRLTANDSAAHLALVLHLEQTIREVLLLANNGSYEEASRADEDTMRLHAVIERLRQLKKNVGEASSSIQAIEFPCLEQQRKPVETISLLVGPAEHTKLLFARLTIAATAALSVAPSTSPAAHIQLHLANGSLFQSLAADFGVRQLTKLRVRDDTLLAFLEGCCRVRVFIYRGIQGFVPFTQFYAETDAKTVQPFVLQLLAIRLPLRRSPGALYTVVVVQAHRVTFYELVMPGFFENWMLCK